jgi:RHS repeat-associated protein
MSRFFTRQRTLSFVISCALTYALLFPPLPTRALPGVSAPAPAAKNAATPTAQGAPRREGELIVLFREGVTEQEKGALLGAKGGRRGRTLRGESRVDTITTQPGQDVGSLAAELRWRPEVEFVEPNFLVRHAQAGAPADPRFVEQWALKNTGQAGGAPDADINAAGAWGETTGARTTVVAVIDSGVDFTHPDLKNNEWVNAGERPGNNRDDDRDGYVDDANGWDWVADSPAIRDGQGHGTAVAGIIAAEGNNGVGTAGVMWRASLMSLRVLDNVGTGDVASAVEAIDYAVAHGAQVINCSWGTEGESAALRDAIARAGQKGVVVVTSAGNSGSDIGSQPYYPAFYDLPNLIAVASTDQFDNLTPFSNWGSTRVPVAAPGVDVLTTKMGGDYWSVSGTSVSAPLVAGIAGLVKTQRPRLSAEATRLAVVNGARKVDALAGRVSSGGVASAAGALRALGGGPYGAPPGQGNAAGGDGNGNANGQQGGQSPPPPPAPAHGGRKQDDFKGTPAPTTQSAAANLPELDKIRGQGSYVPQGDAAPIRSNLAPICDTCYEPPDGDPRFTGDTEFSNARSRPQNETGEPGVDLGSRNFNWSTPLVSLPGRAGLDLNLVLYYNSLVWTRQGAAIQFNPDNGFPGPGFRLGFPTIQERFVDSETGAFAYMSVTASGGRVTLKRVGASSLYEATDGSYLQFDEGTNVMRETDGTQFFFVNIANGEKRCTQIRDRNGNYIGIAYDGANRVDYVVDTLGRVVDFVYDGDGNLVQLTQDRAASGHTNLLASFAYGSALIQPSFPGLSVFGPVGQYVTVLTQVSYPDGTRYNFNYNTYGQVWQIVHSAPDNHTLSWAGYNLPGSAWVGDSAQSDCPRFTERHDWVEYGVMNQSQEVVTSFAAASDGSWSQITMPDGTVHKEFFHTSGWASGLPYQTEEWSGGARKKWTTTAWTQDDVNLPYAKNPRPYETNVYDEAGNRRRTTIEYLNGFSLPTHVRVFGGPNGDQFLRFTVTNYKQDADYVNRRVIGLPYERLTYDGQTGRVMSREIYHYDWGDPYFSAQAPSTNYVNPGYVVGRGNLVAVRRYNCSSDAAAYDENQAVWTALTGYNMAGSRLWTQDANGHRVNTSYSDSYSDGNNGRNTLAYPTSLTDPDGYTSTTQYDYSTGAVTQSSRPSSGTAAQGNVTYETRTMLYDWVARPQRATTQNTGAYTRWEYPASANYLLSYSTVVAGAGESYSGDFFDGAGKLRASSSSFPGSAGGYRAVHLMWDAMGRIVMSSNPTEINASWAPSGDDAAGWVWTNQAYDWKGRPTVTTEPDGYTSELSYTGCGCAGGEVTTARDERGRRRRLYRDVFNRLSKVEELNWDQSVYSTTTYSYNVLNQLTQINQQGLVRTLEYDGFGRLWRRTTPEQGATTYTYNADDTLQTMTDARGASTTLGYTPRHLVASITYGVPAGVQPTANVSYTYDAAGNRTQMNDGMGYVTYAYDSLSRLTSETRYFSELGAAYTLGYGYNLAGGLTSFTNPWGVSVGYTQDYAGQVTGVTGANYAGVSTYASGLYYRASGALKQMTYGNGRVLTATYDNRLRPKQWNVSGVAGWEYFYDYLGEHTGRVVYAQNLYDATVGGRDARRDRAYDYDHVGRLTYSTAGSNARNMIGLGDAPQQDGPYSQDYDYDVYGNITLRQGWGGEAASYGPISYTNNRRNGFSYDAAGNLTFDLGQHFYYDAAGRQTYVDWTNLQQWYDGDGLRVKKSDSSDTVFYLRSSALGGHVVAEIRYAPGYGWHWSRGYVFLGGETLAMQAGGVFWVHQDPETKSKRMTDAAGAVTSGMEFDPWGGMAGGGWSWNTGQQPRKFTSYERDQNGTDEAMHRRYNRWHSRFDQPDPTDVSYDFTNPQSFNRYAYVKNDPVNFVDPTGLYEGCVHEGMTKFLAQLAKYDASTAAELGRRAGERSGGADSFKYSALNPINIFKSLFGKGPSADIHFASEKKLQEEIGKFPGYIASGNLKKAGFTLHSIQDVHGAHEGYGLPRGHFPKHEPDRLIGDDKFMRAANETLQTLTGDKNASLSLLQTLDLIDAIVAACGKDAKKLTIIPPPVPLGGSIGGGGGGGIDGGGGGGFVGYPSWWYSMWDFVDWVDSIDMSYVEVGDFVPEHYYEVTVTEVEDED